MNQDILSIVLYHLNPQELDAVSSVSKSWADARDMSQIRKINGRKFTFKMTEAKKIIARLITNLHCRSLEYADFNKFKDFDNKCLENLVAECPNIKHLNLGHTGIQGDALKHVNKLALLNLDISACQKLDTDALKHLMPSLEKLVLVQCTQLEKNALEHLEKAPSLKILNISWCTQLAQNALKIAKIPLLQDLNISWCMQLDKDTLHTLKSLIHLHTIDISRCQFSIPPELVQKVIRSE